jgi:hypothetical protein
VAAPALTGVKQAVLDILTGHPGAEVRGRDLRGLLGSRGFRRSAPAFVFTMLRLGDKGLVTCREEVRVVGGVEIRERYYRGGGWRMTSHAGAHGPTQRRPATRLGWPLAPVERQ